MFSTNKDQIIRQIQEIDPLRYSATRNYVDGAVTKLSPYIARGVISTKQIVGTLLKKGYRIHEIEGFLKELAWREYFQRVWIAKGDEIDRDLKHPQIPVSHHQIPAAVVAHQTGIEAIDNAIESLYSSGYMHNHVRMYVASICCNMGRSHWLSPAQWMYYYLLDADWASNALSWQWVAGSFSSKKYYANQTNINTYCHTSQTDTFLDRSYESLEQMQIPEPLRSHIKPTLRTKLPETNKPIIDKSLPVCIYNFYQLDFRWLPDLAANRILLLEPSFFDRYPVCSDTIRFVVGLSENIPGIQVVVDEFETVLSSVPTHQIHYKEHPTNAHYRGVAHDRDWIFEEVEGYFPSFSAYWKQCAKRLSELEK